MQRYTLCVLLVFCVCTAGAQPLAAAFKNAARTLPGKTVSAEALGRRAAQLLAERSAPAAFAAARKQCLQLVAAEDKQIYCPADVPPAFSLRNKLLTQARRELLEKNWQLFLQRPQAAQALYSPHINYADIIPSSARLIFLGEIHDQNTIHQEIYHVIKDYRTRYPGRRIYILAESVADDGIVYHASNWGEKGPYQKSGAARAQMLEVLVKEQGVFLTGLERPGLVRLYNSSAALRQAVVRKYVSASGLEIRNRGFLEKIVSLRRLDPQAVFFVYGGKAHWSYTHAGSVTLALNTGTTFVMDFIPRGWRLPSSIESIWNTWLSTQPAQPAGQYGVYTAADKTAARMLGSDVKIETPKDFLLNWR